MVDRADVVRDSVVISWGHAMSEVATSLLEQVLALPEADRHIFADELQARLGGEEKRVNFEDVVQDPDYRAELVRRMEAVANGTAVLLDGEQVVREARERLKKSRGQ